MNIVLYEFESLKFLFQGYGSKIFEMVLLNSIASILSFNTFIIFIRCIIAWFKNRNFNGYWTLARYNDQKEFFAIIKIKETFHHKVKIKILSVDKIIKKIRDCGLLENVGRNVADKYQAKEIHIRGQRIDNSLCLTFIEPSQYGYANLISYNRNLYWTGEYLMSIGGDSKCELSNTFKISLSKMKGIDDAVELMMNSSRDMPEKDGVKVKAEVLLSVIITTYNDEDVIRKCLNSILNTAYNLENKIEILIIDDGSYDHTERVVNSYQKENCQYKIEIIKTIHRGSNFARNLGMHYAIGKYLIFINPRDRLESGAVNILAQISLERDEDIIIGGYHEFTNELGAGRKYVVDYNLKGCYTVDKFISCREDLRFLRLGAVWGKLYKNSMLKFTGYQIEEGYFGDTFFNIDLQRENIRIYIYNKIWYQYYLSNINAMVNAISVNEYITGQFNALLRYTSLLDSVVFSKDKKQDYEKRREYILSYYTEIKIRVEKKVHQREVE